MDDVFRRMREQMKHTLQDLEESFRELERNIDGSTLSARTSVPVDVQETGDEIIITADLPGIEKDRIDVNVTEHTLQLRARDEREVTEEGADYVRQERQSRNYRRQIRLPAPVDPKSADASYRDGVLTVTVEKRADRSGSSVEIN